MSLFPSAFDTAASTSFTASPSQSGPSQPKSQKRKRPSAGGAGAGAGGGGKNDQLRSTQANLEKLMSRVEKGQVGTKTEGREEMGLGAGKGKKHKKNQGAERRVERVEDRHAHGGRPGPGHGKQGATGRKPFEGTQSSRQDHAHGTRPKAQTQVGTGPSSVKPVHSNQAAKPAPAELPLPHAISPGKGKRAADSEESAGLTDLQKNMRTKLEGARFRWINEQLYSTPSTEAVAMMKKDPKIFADYHMTHRALTSAWPSPPLPHLIDLLAPLPPKTLIVDLGCGDAGLARALVPQGKIVLSYDLVGDSGVPGEGSGGEGWVTEADFLEKVPLPGRPGGIGASTETTGTGGEPVAEGKKHKKRRGKDRGNGNDSASEVVDVVVCCLSLMGVNWVGGIYEACRILKQGGTLHIAEVTSRFVSVPDFIAKVESFGLELEHQESPSTHFTLFRFIKVAAVPQGPARGQDGWTRRVGEGESILRGCVYKKR